MCVEFGLVHSRTAGSEQRTFRTLVDHRGETGQSLRPRRNTLVATENIGGHLVSEDHLDEPEDCQEGVLYTNRTFGSHEKLSGCGQKNFVICETGWFLCDGLIQFYQLHILGSLLLDQMVQDFRSNTPVL